MPAVASQKNFKGSLFRPKIPEKLGIRGVATTNPKTTTNDHKKSLKRPKNDHRPPAIFADLFGLKTTTLVGNDHRWSHCMQSYKIYVPLAAQNICPSLRIAIFLFRMKGSSHKLTTFVLIRFSSHPRPIRFFDLRVLLPTHLYKDCETKPFPKLLAAW